ncbi:MAG TPA: hypothetical protein VEX69_09035 [Candidatus Limnocylindria bacterium]|nr:hypothetical protein [Candidatus Limnocylindria bacterium]
MARYESLVGKRVEAQYRAGEIQLSAIGILTSDSGNSVIVEDRFSAGGKDKTMRVEIPYDYLLRLAEAKPNPTSPALMPSPTKERP